MNLHKLAKEVAREQRSERDGLSERAYNRIADGGRAKPRAIHMSPERIAVMRRALGME